MCEESKSKSKYFLLIFTPFILSKSVQSKLCVSEISPSKHLCIEMHVHNSLCKSYCSVHDVI